MVRPTFPGLLRQRKKCQATGSARSAVKGTEGCLATTGRLDVEIVSYDNLPVYGLKHCVFMVPKVPPAPD